MFSMRTRLTRIPIHLRIFSNSSEPSKTLQLGTDESDCPVLHINGTSEWTYFDGHVACLEHVYKSQHYLQLV